jgi:type IV pilus assembly protein PilM
MAAASDAVWAIDLGNNSLKALHLVAVGDAVQVIGFDHIPHGKVLTSGVSAAEKVELVAITLRQFVQNNDLGFDPIIISVPSQNSFARFVTLPPVEAKRLPEIVRFEAAANPLRHERDSVGLAAHERPGQSGEEGRAVRHQKRGGQRGHGVLRA